jgi:hypothetical protein
MAWAWIYTPAEKSWFPLRALLSNIAQKIAGNPLALPVGIKETDHSFGLLKRLNQSVQKNPINPAFRIRFLNR